MSSENVRNYYIAALHALRSASEQGAATALKLEEKARDHELKAIVVDYGKLAENHRQKITGFLADLDLQPNGFKDRVMEGVGNGTDEMLKAASEEAIDLGVLSGAQTGAQYYRHAFHGQPSTARAFGLDDQAATWAGMADEWRRIQDRLAQASKTVFADAMRDEPVAA